MQTVRSIFRRIDPGFLVVLAISIIAIWPFLRNAGLPEGTDAELHIFRLAELSTLLQGGEFYPRWAPNFYHGYGYPIFNYYAPLTYYLGSLLDVTPWFDATAAVKGVFILGMLLAGLGMYGFVRDNWGRGAGYVATAVFLYAPYVQFIDPHIRGVLPESFSFGVFAVALWALDRLYRTGGRWAWGTAVVLVAAVILSHNLMGLLFFTLLAAWAVWRLLGERWQGAERQPGRKQLLPALALGVGVAAIFWLPVLLERNLVNLNTLLGEGDNYDFHTHFLNLRDLLGGSLLLDWGATEPAFRFNLGLAQWLLGGLGLLMLLLRRVKHGWHLSFFALVLAGLLFLMLPISTFLWETLPFLPFFQFPWRLLGAAAAMLAVLAGAGAEALGRTISRKEPARSPGWITALLVTFPILLGLPLSQPPPWPDFGEVNALRMTLIENTGRWLGTTSTADYVPVTVETIPTRKGSVVANFDLGLPLDRVNRAMLPEGATVESEEIRPLLTRYVVDSPRDTRFRLFLFDFSGWHVRVDGQQVETELGKPEGFLVIPLSAGQHVVEVEFGSTPARTLAIWLSFGSLILMLFFAWRLPNKHFRGWGPFRDWLVLGVVLGITAVTILFLDPLGVMHYNSRGLTAQPAQVQTYADFGEQLALLGYDSSHETAAAGDLINLNLYWKAQQPLDINYQVFIHMFSADNQLVAQSDKLNPGDFPTRRWPTDKYVRDSHQLTLPSDLPAGEYTIATGIWVVSEGWRLPLLSERGQQVGDNVTLFELEVE